MGRKETIRKCLIKVTFDQLHPDGKASFTAFSCALFFQPLLVRPLPKFRMVHTAEGILLLEIVSHTPVKISTFWTAYQLSPASMGDGMELRQSAEVRYGEHEITMKLST